MHKKLEADLVSLAHSILQMKNRSEASALKNKAREIYEKLAILTFVEDHMATNPNLNISKVELLGKMESALKNEERVHSEEVNVEQSLVENSETNTDELEEKEEEDIFVPKFDSVKIDIESLRSNQISLKEEFRDAISADKTSTLFDEVENKGSEKTKIQYEYIFKDIDTGLKNIKDDLNSLDTKTNTTTKELHKKGFKVNDLLTEN